MKKERAILPVGKILLNEGQLDWLPRNPRTWTQTDIDNTAASILEDEDFLEERPILVVPFNKGTYIAFAGNLRHEGAVATKKVKKVPCVIHYPETAEDYETIKRRAIKDNGSFGKWDTDIAANEWGDIPWAAWGAPDWMGDAEGQEQGGAEGGTGLGGTRVSGNDDDYDPDQKVNERVKRGEIWALGHHRLMCGDSTNPADVERLMGGGASSDLWLTDPPYNLNYGANMISEDGKGDKTIMNDNMADSDFHQFLLKVDKNAVAHMKPGAAFYICHSDSEGLNFRGACKEAGLTVRQCLIWEKDSLVLGRQDYQWIHEPILYGWKEGAGHSWYNDRKQVTVLKFDRPKKSDLHPTMKPIPLFVYLIQNSSKEGDIVLDLFGGSGTTIIACEQTGRVGYTMELDEHYASVIVDRWEKFTGLTAEKIQSAE